MIGLVAAQAPVARGIMPGASDRVLRAAAAMGGMSVDALKARDRRPPVVRVRWAVMLAMRRAGFSFEAIGHRCGGRGHHAAMNGVEQGARMEAADADFAGMVAACSAALLRAGAVA